MCDVYVFAYVWVCAFCLRILFAPCHMCAARVAMSVSYCRGCNVLHSI